MTVCCVQAGRRRSLRRGGRQSRRPAGRCCGGRLAPRSAGHRVPELPVTAQRLCGLPVLRVGAGVRAGVGAAVDDRHGEDLSPGDTAAERSSRVRRVMARGPRRPRPGRVRRPPLPVGPRLPAGAVHRCHRRIGDHRPSSVGEVRAGIPAPARGGPARARGSRAARRRPVPGPHDPRHPRHDHLVRRRQEVRRRAGGPGEGHGSLFLDGGDHYLSDPASRERALRAELDSYRRVMRHGTA